MIVNQILLVLALQLTFFAFFYRFGIPLAKIIGRRVCPVCFAVSSTWLTLLFLKVTGVYATDTRMIAILLSESVVGVSYLVEEFKLVYNVEVEEVLVKFGIILYGTFAVSTFAFLNEAVGFGLFLPVIVFGFFSLTPLKK